MKKILSKIVFSVITFSLLSSVTYATESQPQSGTPHKSVGSQAGGSAGKKGGIYKVGRGFKYAGHEMKEGFKTAGRGIEKGGKAAGRGFKKAGHSIHDFFTGESSDDKKK